MARRRLSFKTRLLILWVGSLALALGLVGLIFVRLLTGLHEEQSRQQIAQVMADLRRDMVAEREHLTQTAARFAARSDVVASVHLVENYQDPQAYRPLIFDVEKARLARELRVVARAARASIATVEGSNAGLLAFYARDRADAAAATNGYVTYASGAPRPRLLQGENDEPGPMPPAVADLVATRAPTAHGVEVVLRQIDGNLMQVAHAAIADKSGGATGVIRIGTALGAGGIAELGPRADMEMTLRFHAPGEAPMFPALPRLDSPRAFEGETWWVPDDTHFAGGAWLPLDDGGRATVLVRVPKTHVATAVGSFRTAALSGLLVVALVVGPLGLFFVNRTLSRPAERLKASIHGLGAGRYKALEAGGIEPQEIRDVFETLNMMADAVAGREAELRESRQRYHDLYDKAPVAYASVAAESRRITECNSAFERISGRRREDLLGMDVLSLFSEAANGRMMAEGIFRRAEQGQASENMELRLQRPDGGLSWVSLTAHPLTDQTGQLLETRVAMLDVTDRREAQHGLMRSLDELARANAELERFAHVAAHDLKEPVRQIVTYAQLLERRLAKALDEPNPDFEALLGYIIEGGQRLSTLIDDLLAYAEGAHKETGFERVEMTEVVAAALENLHEVVRERGARVTVADDLPPVRGDKLQLMQMIQNLLSNALKFVPAERRPEIEVSAEPDGTDWCFTVRDNGIGIEAPHIARIFDVFHRVHPRTAYPGTGIGLSICKRVVENHGGRIWVESVPGEGSSFHFTLPAADDSLAAHVAAGEIPSRRG